MFQTLIHYHDMILDATGPNNAWVTEHHRHCIQLLRVVWGRREMLGSSIGLTSIIGVMHAQSSMLD
jgi:hypothetical protein